MTQRVTQLLVACVCALVASCAGPRHYAAAPEPLPAQTRATLALDTNADGVIDQQDVRWFLAVAQAAVLRAQQLGELAPEIARLVADAEIANAAAVVPGAFYQGPSEGPLFAMVSVTGNKADIQKIPSERLIELAIESRWLAVQARLAKGAGLTPTATLVGGMLSNQVPGYSDSTMEPAAVCAAVENVNLSSYERAQLSPAAVLDIDSTVWAGNGTDALLAALIELSLPKEEGNAHLQAFLMKLPGANAEQIDAASVLDNAKELLRRADGRDVPKEERVNPKDAFYQTVALLRGLTPEQGLNAAKHAIETGTQFFPPWKTRLFDDRDGCGMARIIMLLKKRGITPYLLSATPQPMAEAAARYLGVPAAHALGSRLAIKDGVYTGEVSDNTYEVKGSLVRQWLSAPPLFAFGDSPSSDWGMLLESVGASFMVNPRPSFLERDTQEAGGRFVSVTFDGTEAELTSVAQ